MSQSHAVAQNEKVFPILSHRLTSGNPNDYVVTVHKLRTWLSSDKAYYPAARGKIIELLEVRNARIIAGGPPHRLCTARARGNCCTSPPPVRGSISTAKSVACHCNDRKSSEEHVP
ncbi:hypothetical protein BKA83DRAFT_1996873 [Pisolithus microcarpus]|nr:hypothetical protein BKA83DRAFT_1996873 [Pisolithus microcarpus]